MMNVPTTFHSIHQRKRKMLRKWKMLKGKEKMHLAADEEEKELLTGNFWPQNHFPNFHFGPFCHFGLPPLSLYLSFFSSSSLIPSFRSSISLSFSISLSVFLYLLEYWLFLFFMFLFLYHWENFSLWVTALSIRQRLL